MCVCCVRVRVRVDVRVGCVRACVCARVCSRVYLYIHSVQLSDNVSPFIGQPAAELLNYTEVKRTPACA